MVKNPDNSFTLLSLIYIILLTVVYFSKPRAKNLETKIYSYIVITCLVGCIVSLGTYFFMFHIDMYPILNEIFARSYLLFILIYTSLVSYYVLAISINDELSDERKEKYDFSDAYYDSGVGMAVKADSDIESYEDLEGETVAVKMGTDGQAFAESIAEEYGFEIKVMEGSDEMYQDVLVGNSAACFDDYPVLGFEISRGKAMKLPLPMEAGSQYGFAVVKGENPELIEMFNAGLANLKESGQYDEILAKYISVESGEEEEATEAE